MPWTALFDQMFAEKFHYEVAYISDLIL